MKVIKKDEQQEQGTTLLFELADVASKKVTLGKTMIAPGQRLPAEGTTAHAEDEYGYIMKGNIYTYSGGVEQLVEAGSATFIPRGEEHWARNDGTEPVEVLWLFVE